MNFRKSKKHYPNAMYIFYGEHLVLREFSPGNLDGNVPGVLFSCIILFHDRAVPWEKDKHGK